MMRILFVDDDERFANLVRRGLGESGHVVDCAHTGAVGLAFKTERSYDAIVLDVVLPELDGYAIVRRLRAEGSTTPVLSLTASPTSPSTCARGERNAARAKSTSPLGKALLEYFMRHPGRVMPRSMPRG